MTPRQLMWFAGLAIGVGAVSAARAAQKDNPWSITIYAGDSILEEGRLRNSRTAQLPDLGVLDPDLAGNAGTLELHELHYHDVLHSRFSASFEVDYMADEHFQLFGRFNYDWRQGRSRSIGTVTSSALTAQEPLVAHFHDSEAQGLEVGTRYFWRPSATWSPYLAAALGATRSDEIRASINVPNTAIRLNDVHFTNSETAFSQSLETGLEYKPTERFHLRFSVRATHTGAAKSSRDPELTELGFGSHSDAGNRVTFPVALALVIGIE